VALVDRPEEIRRLVGGAFTDPERKRRTDPGRPEVCNVFTLHGFFTDPARVEAIAAECRAATLGCVDDKKALAESMIEGLAPIRERYLALRADEGGLRATLAAGAAKARAIARETLETVRERMGLTEGGRTP